MKRDLRVMIVCQLTQSAWSFLCRHVMEHSRRPNDRYTVGSLGIPEVHWRYLEAYFPLRIIPFKFYRMDNCLVFTKESKTFWDPVRTEQKSVIHPDEHSESESAHRGHGSQTYVCVSVQSRAFFKCESPWFRHSSILDGVRSCLTKCIGTLEVNIGRLDDRPHQQNMAPNTHILENEKQIMTL